MKKIFIKTFGCQMNIYDSQKIYRLLEDEYEPVDTPAEADLVIINTCSVRDKPEQKVYSYLGELKEFKKSKKEFIIGVGGCVAQQEGENIIKRSKLVDFVFGTHNISLVPALINEHLLSGKAVSALDYRDGWETLPIGLGGETGVSSFVAISRGCNKRCSYCIVPTTRGSEVSRDAQEVIREVQYLANKGVKEIVLLGQTVNSYGIDLKPQVSFAKLLNMVSEVDGVERIRFTSPHPNFMTKDLIACVATNPKVCHHFHVPLQSGNDRILKLMKRGYTQARYMQMIEDIKVAVPDMAFTTDVIVGFPGETREEFNDTVDVMQKVPFSASFSFAYSPRPNTPAATMSDQIPQEEKFDRLYEYQRFQEEVSAQYLNSWLGKKCQILIEGVSKDDDTLLYGRNSQNVVINLLPSENKFEVGQLIDVEIVGLGKHTLKGKA